MFSAPVAFLFPMDADETKFLPTGKGSPERKPTENEPFEFGERTIFSLRNQDFSPADEFGTVILKPHRPEVPAQDAELAQPDTRPDEEQAPVIEAPSPEVISDPLARIEFKLDLALRQIHSLQQRLESLDATIARSLLR